VVGQWEPLISVAEWEALNAVLSSRANSPAPRPVGHNAWKYLLSGLLRCGECGKPMRGMSNTSHGRSYWIPGSYASLLSKNRNVFLSPLKSKGFKEEIVTKIGLYDLLKSTTLASNKSHRVLSGPHDWP
jgi:Recombinase zinc beta ribbon domain